MIEDKEFRSKVLYVCIGVLIPIIAALIPYGFKFLFPEHDLNYSIINKARVENFKIVQIQIENNGEKLERHIEVILKKDIFLTLPEENKLSPLITTKPDTLYEVSETLDSYVINLGNLRPNEKLNLSVLSEAIAYSEFGTKFGEDIVLVRSEENTGRLKEPSKFLQEVYPFTFWSFVLLMAVVLIGGIYQDYFESKEKREARLLKELDKLKDKI